MLDYLQTAVTTGFDYILVAFFRSLSRFKICENKSNRPPMVFAASGPGCRVKSRMGQSTGQRRCRQTFLYLLPALNHRLLLFSLLYVLSRLSQARSRSHCCQCSKAQAAKAEQPTAGQKEKEKTIKTRQTPDKRKVSAFSLR